MTTYNVISGDSHLEISPQRWTPRVPAQYRDRAPRLIKLPHGGDGIILEGRDLYVLGLAITGKPPQEHRLYGVSYETGPGAGSPEQRVKEQQMDGVDAEILYTSAGNAGFWRGIRDDGAYNAVIHAYNEFLAGEYSVDYPDRLIPMAVIPQSTIDAAVSELEYCAKAGIRGVMLSTFPSGKGFPTPEDDRFWAAALDLDMPITAHVNFNGRSGPYFQYTRRPKEAAFGADPIRALGRFAQGEHVANYIALMLAGVFDRFPKLQIYFAETMVGWVPAWMEQLDDTYERNRYWMERDFGIEPLKRRPSEYLWDNTIWGFLYDPFGVEVHERINVDNAIWGSDFPHSASNWPHSQEVLDNMFDGISPNVRKKMTCDNAVRFFHLQNGA